MVCKNYQFALPHFLLLGCLWRNHPLWLTQPCLGNKTWNPLSSGSMPSDFEKQFLPVFHLVLLVLNKHLACEISFFQILHLGSLRVDFLSKIYLLMWEISKKLAQKQQPLSIVKDFFWIESSFFSLCMSLNFWQQPKVKNKLSQISGKKILLMWKKEIGLEEKKLKGNY